MNTAIYTTSQNETNDCAFAPILKALASRLQRGKRGLQLKLAGSSAGRIVLHLVLAIVTCHFAWHYQGIVRELTRH